MTTLARPQFQLDESRWAILDKLLCLLPPHKNKKAGILAKKAIRNEIITTQNGRIVCVSNPVPLRENAELEKYQHGVTERETDLPSQIRYSLEFKPSDGSSLGRLFSTPLAATMDFHMTGVDHQRKKISILTG